MAHYWLSGNGPDGGGGGVSDLQGAYDGGENVAVVSGTPIDLSTDGIGYTNVQGLVLSNNTPADVIETRQSAPTLSFWGSAYDTSTGTSAETAVELRLIPATGATPYSVLGLYKWDGDAGSESWSTSVLFGTTQGAVHTYGGGYYNSSSQGYTQTYNGNQGVELAAGRTSWAASLGTINLFGVHAASFNAYEHCSLRQYPATPGSGRWFSVVCDSRTATFPTGKTWSHGWINSSNDYVERAYWSFENTDDRGLNLIESGLAATTADALRLVNPTAALTGEREQWSPQLSFVGNCWNTTLGSNQEVGGRMYLVANDGTTTGLLGRIQVETYNNGDYNDAWIFGATNGGDITNFSYLPITTPASGLSLKLGSGSDVGVEFYHDSVIANTGLGTAKTFRVAHGGTSYPLDFLHDHGTEPSQGRIFGFYWNSNTASAPDTKLHSWGYIDSSDDDIETAFYNPGSSTERGLNLIENNALTATLDGLRLVNNTDSDVTNTVQNPPHWSIVGSAWDTDGAVARDVGFRFRAHLTSGTVPSARARLGFYDGSSWSDWFDFYGGSSGYVFRMYGHQHIQKAGGWLTIGASTSDAVSVYNAYNNTAAGLGTANAIHVGTGGTSHELALIHDHNTAPASGRWITACVASNGASAPTGSLFNVGWTNSSNAFQRTFYVQPDGEAVALGFSAEGDPGGTASMTTITNATAAADSTAASLGNTPTGIAAAPAGWTKIYVGTTTAYVPYWTA
jgi:hypothetical protein